jgi:orotidine 5'-phosphate decarboxylase subfamily 2
MMNELRTPAGAAGTASATRDRTLPTFYERLDDAMRSCESLLCVGLDPHPRETVDPIADHCRRIIDATVEFAVAYKPNSAFFEASGPDGLATLAAVIAHVPDDRIVILDAKRGDIGSTARAYASAAFDMLGADAITVNPYLGDDAVLPFIENPVRGAFVLCHTSNPGAMSFQHLVVNGWPLYMEVAGRAITWNETCNVGLVLGATYPESLAAVRGIAPTLPFLVPGVGAQGGDLAAAVAAGIDDNGRGLLISSSRGIFFADDPGSSARTLRDAINKARESEIR